MAITRTTLAAALGAADTKLKATAATGATVGGYAQVEREWMVITAITGTVIDVARRGSFGTVAAAHHTLAPLMFCTEADMPNLGIGQGTGLTSTPRDVLVWTTALGAIPLPSRDTVVLFGGGEACVVTIADPVGVPDGTFITFVSTTAYAHTVTLVTGAISGAADVFTWANVVGHTLTLMAYKGLWCHITVSMLPDDATAGVTVA